MDTQTIVTALNEMQELLELGQPTGSAGRLSELAEAARIGCSALIHLYNDNTFYNDLRLLLSARQSDGRGYLEITSSVDHFVNHFLEYEMRLLHEHGANRHVVAVLKCEATELQSAVRASTLDIAQIQRQIHRLQTIACSIARAMEEQWARRQAQKTEMAREGLSAVMTGLGGAVIIGLNTTYLSISPAGAAVSGVLGAELIKVSVERIFSPGAAGQDG